MNILQQIKLTQFRNYGSAVFAFPEAITCITGANGSGKTNLLDGVYYLCYTKSYFSSQLQHSAQIGTDGFRVEGWMNNGLRQEVISCKWKAGKKEILADESPYERFADHIGKYAAVMIAPDDLELINDGSELRRKWLDGILGQTDKKYLECLMQYQRVLLQRNAWLKQEAFQPTFNTHSLDFYNQQLARCGSYIFEQRKLFLSNFRSSLSQYYLELSGGVEQVSIRYESDLLERATEEWLNTGLQNDLRAQRTLRGIHKDDLVFEIDGMLLKQFGSQGQKKSFLFALKLAQYSFLKQSLGRKPILLLDDIFEKLDQRRMEALLRIIRGDDFGQVMLTDTHAARVRAAFGDDVEVGFITL